MVARLDKSMQDVVPLPGVFQAYFFQMRMKTLLRFPHGLAREAGMIVNAFLDGQGGEADILIESRFQY